MPGSIENDDESERVPIDKRRIFFVVMIAAIGSSSAAYCGIAPSNVDDERANWTPVPCMVVGIDVEVVVGGCGRGIKQKTQYRYEPAIGVAYEFAGKPHQAKAGYTVTFTSCGKPSEELRAKALQAAESYLLDERLICVVDPVNPTMVHVPLRGIALDMKEKSKARWMIVLMLTTFTIGLCIKVWRALAPPPPAAPEEDWSHLNKPPG